MSGQAGTPAQSPADREGILPDRERAPVLVSTGEAARLASVNVRTIRRWIERGYLPSEHNERGALVSPADLPAAKARADRAAGGRHPTGTRADALPREDARVQGTRADTFPLVAVNAREQLQAIRDEWLAPLIAEIGETREQLGRVTAERDQAHHDRDALQARVSTLEATHVEVPQSQPDAPQTQPQRTWWAFWKR